MGGFELIFSLLVAGLLLFFIVNALITQSVWVRGRRMGQPGEAWFTHKRSRADEPKSYWFVLGLYTLGLVWLVWLSVSA